MHASDRYLKTGTIEDLRKEEDSAGYARRLAHGVIGRGMNDYDKIFSILELRRLPFLDLHRGWHERHGGSARLRPLPAREDRPAFFRVEFRLTRPSGLQSSFRRRTWAPANFPSPGCKANASQWLVWSPWLVRAAICGTSEGASHFQDQSRNRSQSGSKKAPLTSCRNWTRPCSDRHRHRHSLDGGGAANVVRHLQAPVLTSLT